MAKDKPGPSALPWLDQHEQILQHTPDSLNYISHAFVPSITDLILARSTSVLHCMVLQTSLSTPLPHTGFPVLMFFLFIYILYCFTVLVTYCY